MLNKHKKFDEPDDDRWTNDWISNEKNDNWQCSAQEDFSIFLSTNKNHKLITPQKKTICFYAFQ